MKSPENSKILIVGAGLAGILLALELESQGADCLLTGWPFPGQASAIAAGIINPITGRHLKKTWLADRLLPFAKQHYKELEKRLGARFYFDLPNIRPLLSQEEADMFRHKIEQEALQDWIEWQPQPPNGPLPHLHAEAGYLITKYGGYVDVPTLLLAAKQYLLGRGKYITAQVQPTDVGNGSNNSHIWMGQQFAQVVLCLGSWGKGWPGQEHLPLQPLKGELLILSDNKGTPLPGVLNRNSYLAPRADGSLWAGSTYQHKYDDVLPTEKGGNQILEKVAAYYNAPMQVLQHKAGLRPSVADRRPLVGEISAKPNTFVFNGLGTKGVTLGPFFAAQLVGNILRGTEIDPACNPEREIIRS